VAVEGRDHLEDGLAVLDGRHPAGVERATVARPLDLQVDVGVVLIQLRSSIPRCGPTDLTPVVGGSP
jgi:hypothetical protein